MKILLHALVGYLAATALPFCSFAFASPLAATSIDYDGYVNTTQSHSDSALMKRVLPGDIIEARQLGIIIPVVVVIDALFVAAAATIIWIKGDDPKREKFTQRTITKTIAKYPKLNWVICHSSYSIAFDGVEGTDYGHNHYELGISLLRTIGYDLYWARSGTFYRYGDGGFINWAYNGNILGTDDEGFRVAVHFGKIT